MAHKNRITEPKIRLKTSSPSFRAEQFATEEFNDESFLTMRWYENKEYLNESTCVFLFDTMLNPLPDEQGAKDENGNLKKYLVMPDAAGTAAQFYIFLEQGETGFEVSRHAFICNARRDEDEIAIEIKPAENTEVLEQLIEAMISCDIPSGDVFFENASTHSSFNRGANVQKRLELLESTEFIRIPPGSGQRKLSVSLTAGNELILMSRHLYKRLAMSADGSGYVSKTNCEYVEIGSLLYKRGERIRNRVDIWKIVKLVHDFRTDFYVVAELVASYPRDAEKIREMFPLFYEEHCIPTDEYERREALKHAEPIPYLKDDQQLGDGVLFVPVDTTTNRLSTDMGEYFHFAMESNRGLGHFSKGDGKLSLTGNSGLCSLVECERRFRLVYYRLSGYAKHGDEYYAKMRFRRASKWLDSLDDNEAFDQGGVEFNHRVEDKSAVVHAQYCCTVTLSSR